MSVVVAGLSKSFGDVGALRGIDLTVDEGELLVILGPSGSGKTTLLRCIAGLEEPDEGVVSVGEVDVTQMPPGDRDVAMVFQEYALYPHLDIANNVAFGLRARKVPRDEIRDRIDRAMTLLGLQDAATRKPAQLSGGEKQRVALARAIVREPRAFLMDEPLANLDAELRTRTRAEIRALQRQLGRSMIYVTHDQIEALTMADRIALLRGGRVEQVARPRELYDAPANAFVARFLGSPPMNLLPAALQRGPDGAETIGIRAERISFVSPGEGRLRGTVKVVEPIGGEAIVHVDVSGHDVLVRAHWDEQVQAGDEVGLDYNDDAIHGFAGPDGDAVQ